MNDTDNPYASPKADITAAKVDAPTHELVSKLGENTYRWENRTIRILAEPFPWLVQYAPLYVLVDESQEFRRKNSNQIIFRLAVRQREVAIQVDFLHSFVPWRKKFNLFIGEDFIDHSVIHIQNWWRPWIFVVLILLLTIIALALDAAIRMGRL